MEIYFDYDLIYERLFGLRKKNNVAFTVECIKQQLGMMHPKTSNLCGFIGWLHDMDCWSDKSLQVFKIELCTGSYIWQPNQFNTEVAERCYFWLLRQLTNPGRSLGDFLKQYERRMATIKRILHNQTRTSVYETCKQINSSGHWRHDTIRQFRCLIEGNYFSVPEVHSF